MADGGQRSDLTSLSRTLSKILRHNAHNHKLPIRPDGFVPVQALLALPKLQNMRASIDLIHQMVESDAKRRYTMIQEDANPDSNPDPNTTWLIRANQGHSIAVPDLALTKIQRQDTSKFPIVLHGTNETAYKNIKKEGIKCMTRNHIHLATGKFGDVGVVSGVRKSCTVFIYIDLERCLSEGMQFFRSENGVVLTAGLDGVIPPTLFEKVEFANEDVAKRLGESDFEPAVAMDQLHLTPSSAKEEQTTRGLFGGALSTVLPPTFLDASEFRQVPDTQEVFVSPENQETSLIVELVESLPGKIELAVVEHFKILAEDNEADSHDIAECLSIEPSTGEAWIIHGSQKVGKFNVPDKQVVHISLGVIRLDRVSTDILITHNSTTEQELGRRRVSSAVANFKVNDWSLFA